MAKSGLAQSAGFNWQASAERLYSAYQAAHRRRAAA
jgi:hypothetical protein